MGTKVAVAMSGGVDSSVAAALLKQQGYEVIGLMLRLWSETGREDTNRCCTPDSQSQARRVAAMLDIPFYIVDARGLFYSTVVQSFLDGYAQGVTPNPCLVCNRVIKWDFLYKHAIALGAEFLATGHYVIKQRTETGTWQLRRSVDRSKDQSYVLHVLTQEKLARALFPVGDHPKPEVRDLARSFGLSNAARADSQDLCFLAGEDYREFLRRNAPGIGHSGPILTRSGKPLGEHKGLAFYTIGQRKGLGVASTVPLYVLEKDIVRNTLIVGTEDELGSTRLLANGINWIAGEPPTGRFRAEVKTRYTAKDAPAEVTPIDGGRALVLFDLPQRDITPGQAAVFYVDGVVLGGGIIG